MRLLDDYGIEHTCISRKGSRWVDLGAELIQRNWRLLKVAQEFKPDVMVAAEAGVAVCPVSAVLGCSSLVFDQTDGAHVQRLVAMPFASHICTGESYKVDYGKRHIRFKGVLAQAYLAPELFTPDPQGLVNTGIDPETRYSVIRLVEWNANHDRGRSGIRIEQLKKLLSFLEKYGRVFQERTEAF